MDKDNKLYAAYGSNLNRAQMPDRCPTAKVVGVGAIDDFRLLFRGSRESVVATVEPCWGGSVPVLVWEITAEDEAALDRYEGWPFLYRKESIAVTLDGQIVTAMVYILNVGRPLGQPSCYYYSIILEGYKAAGFDVKVLQRATVDSLGEGVASCD